MKHQKEYIVTLRLNIRTYDEEILPSDEYVIETMLSHLTNSIVSSPFGKHVDSEASLLDMRKIP